MCVADIGGSWGDGDISHPPPPPPCGQDLNMKCKPDAKVAKARICSVTCTVVIIPKITLTL